MKRHRERIQYPEKKDKELGPKYEDYYTAVGLFFGYPKCCIEAFTDNEGDPIPFSLRSENIQKAVKTQFNHGFIPCEKCATLVNKGRATLDSLITKRVCRKKFPEENRSQLGNYLALKGLRK